MDTCFHWRGYFRNNKPANKWKMFFLWLENFTHMCNACWLNIYSIHLTQNLPHHSHHFSSKFHVITFLSPQSSLSDDCEQTPTEAWVALERILGLFHILLHLWLLYLCYKPWNKLLKTETAKHISIFSTCTQKVYQLSLVFPTITFTECVNVIFFLYSFSEKHINNIASPLSLINNLGMILCEELGIHRFWYPHNVSESVSQA